jgi:hypothetical protein
LLVLLQSSRTVVPPCPNASIWTVVPLALQGELLCAFFAKQKKRGSKAKKEAALFFASLLIFSPESLGGKKKAKKSGRQLFTYFVEKRETCKVNCYAPFLF